MLFLLAAFFHILTKRHLANFSLTKERGKSRKRLCVTPSFREPLLVKKRFSLSAGTIKMFILLLLLLLCLPYLQPNHMSMHHMIVHVIDRDRMQVGNDKPLTLWHRKIGK